jgi:hypothetical protein
MSLFGFEADIQKLVKSFNEHLPPATLISMPAVTGTTASISNIESFTSLWLQELSAPDSSNTARVLPVGHTLQGGRYGIAGVLGYGGFSVVYAVTDQPLAIKEVMLNSGGTRASKDKMLLSIVKEIDLLRALDHPNIVRSRPFLPSYAGCARRQPERFYSQEYSNSTSIGEGTNLRCWTVLRNSRLFTYAQHTVDTSRLYSRQFNLEW